MSRSEQSSPGIRLAALAVVTVFGLFLLWPVPTGRMPLSADHTVHLTRAFLVGEQLGHGRLAGWSTTWFFGFPVGELYPPLGDLLVVALHGVGLGLIDWWQSYALGFTLVFLIQGWAMLRAGRAFGLGLAPGLIAALLILADPGMYREGGWMYTVAYGVWPQALATALCWLGFAELCQAYSPRRKRVDTKRVAIAALVLGMSLLAHPMSLPMIAMGVPLLVLCMGLRGGNVRKQLATATFVVLLALAVAAWWLVPMLIHRGWMASYGWLFASLENMTGRALKGEWTYRMPAAVGYLASAGLLWAAIAGKGFARFVAAFALTSWLLASTDVFWTFRLDRVSEGFTHLQYQRFLLAAKPGFYLAIGGLIGWLVDHAIAAARGKWRPQLAPRARGAAVLGSTLVVIGAVSWLVVDSRRAMTDHEVGVVQTERTADASVQETDYRAFLAWAAETRANTDEPYRIAFDANRNLHWFMDSPVETRTGSYKVGFTPGDNFVHKPESRHPEVLDRLGVRYVVSLRRGDRALRNEVERFGDIRVVERRKAEHAIARLDGSGSLEIVDDDPETGHVVVRVSDADADSLLTFNIAGYPRWELRHEGQPAEWQEFPVHGEAAPASIAERRAGVLRGGKANGDDGSEPTLMGVAGPADGEYVLEYRGRRWFDWLAGLVSLVALVVCTLRIVRIERLRERQLRLHALMLTAVDRLHRLTTPLVVGPLLLVVLALVGVRWFGHASEESTRAVGWLSNERARDISGMRASPFKADMLIRSAIRVRSRRKKPATATFPGVTLPDRLTGWVALDDDAAKQGARGKHHFTLEARDGEAWRPLVDMRVRHRPNRVPIDVETGDLAGQRTDLRVRVESEGKSPPALGFDLELEEAP